MTMRASSVLGGTVPGRGRARRQRTAAAGLGLPVLADPLLGYRLAAYADVPAALEVAVAAGLPLVVVAPGDPVLVEGALRPLDGAFDVILTARELGAGGPGAMLSAAARRMAVDPRRLLYVSASRAGIVHAGMLGMRRAWVNRSSDRRRPPQLMPDEEWPSLRGLGAFLGVGSPTLPVAG